MLSLDKLQRSACGLLAGFGLGSLPARGVAAEGTCQLVHTAAAPALDVLQCPSGATVTSESASDVRVFDPSKQGRPSGAKVESGGALIDLPPGYPGGFQVTTPRAVASVRGTRWFVDVTPGRTSVFVARGEVAVSRTAGGNPVALRQGEGVDIGDDTGPLHPTSWPAARVAKLMARFGLR